MSKGSGGTRAGSSGNPRGGVTTTTLSEAEYRRAEAAFDKWIEKTYNG